MSSALDIINDAALFAGVGDLYNALSAEESSLGLRLLNSLLDSEGTQEYSIFDVIEGTITLTPGTSTYTIGPANNLSVVPALITTCTVVDSSTITYPMREVGQEEWADIYYKPASGRPYVWYYGLGAPTAIMYLYPTPSFAGDVLHVWYGAALQSFTNLATVMVAPPGYLMFLTTALGELLALWFKKPLDADHKAKVRQARGFSRTIGQPIKVLGTDVPTDGNRYGYNINTDNQ